MMPFHLLWNLVELADGRDEAGGQIEMAPTQSEVSHAVIGFHCLTYRGGRA